MTKKRRTSRVEPDDTWRQISRDFPRQTGVSDTIYALPTALIARIRGEAPQFFRQEDIEFETALAGGGRTGFFTGRAFTFPLLNSLQETTTTKPLTDSERRVDSQIRAMMESEVVSAGGGEREIELFFQLRKRLENEIERRRRGYVGWLMTDPGFCICRAEFQRNWRSEFEERWPESTLPIALGGQPPPVSKEDRPYFVEYWKLCQRWGLRTLHSWELPEPIDAGVLHPTVHSLDGLGDAGCLLFVPWYLARDETITLRQMMEPISLMTKLMHLGPWLERSPKNFGIDRFAVLMQLFVYFELAIKRRYSERLRGHSVAIYRAIGQFISQIDPDSEMAISAEESIKKVRVMLKKRLRACTDAIAWIRNGRAMQTRKRRRSDSHDS
jgi:hypothetical protein